MIALVLSWTLIVVAGLPAALLLDRNPSRPRILGLAMLLGSGIVWMTLFLMSVTGLAWSRLVVTIAILIVAGALWIAAPRRAFVATPPSWFDLAIVLLVIAHGLAATAGAVGEWDFGAIWGLKGRVFFERGAIDWRFLEHPYNTFAHSDYPLLLPMQYVFLALHGGAWSDRWMGLVTTFFGVALLLIVRDLFARELRRDLAALATLGVASVALSQWLGIAEAPMIAFGAAGVLVIRRGDMTLGAVLLGCAAGTKNEGLALIVAAAVGLLVAKRARDVLRLWPAALLAAPWLVLRAIHTLPTDLASGPLLERSARNALEVVFAICATTPDRPWFWLAIVAGLVLCIRELKRERFVLATVLVQLAFYVGAYVVTPNEVWWHIAVSWSRLLTHVAAPLAFSALVLTGSRFMPASDPRTRSAAE